MQLAQSVLTPSDVCLVRSICEQLWLTVDGTSVMGLETSLLIQHESVLLPFHEKDLPFKNQLK